MRKILNINNHEMGLLFKIADYSLHQLSKVPKKYRAQVALDSRGSLVRNTHLNHLLCKLS